MTSVPTSTTTSSAAVPQKVFGRFKEPRIALPNLIDSQVASFRQFLEGGAERVFKEFSPIGDHAGKKFELTFVKFTFGALRADEQFAKRMRRNYESPLSVIARLKNRTTGEEKEQEIFLADFPMMTPHGTFIINGVERIIVPQLARSYGVFFDAEPHKGKNYFMAKIIPARGAWIEIESDTDGIYVKVDRKRRFPVTQLLRVMGMKTDAEMTDAFEDELGKAAIVETLKHDTAKSLEESYMEIYRRLRDGDIAATESSKHYVQSIFSAERYDFSRVGRFHFNRRFGLPTDDKALSETTLSIADIVRIVSHIAKLNATPGAEADDIDHLGFRRVRFVGELLEARMRVGLSRMKRNIQDRMAMVDVDATLPVQFINPRPFQAAIREFFTTDQLSQLMQQYNTLDEIEHLRRLSTLGKGGLTAERAGLEVRDVHPSHYGRVCPIHTPEGKNIGLVLHLSLYARPNEFGIIETPYAKLVNGRVTNEIVYLNALEEEQFAIAHAATVLDKDGAIVEELVEARKGGKPTMASRDEVDYLEVATNQPFSVATSLIPFVEHDDANRALMGSNMQKQAVPLVVPQAPLVATGIEGQAARDSGRLVLAEEDGEVTIADAKKIAVKNRETGKVKEYMLVNFSRTNGFTAFHQRPSVSVGDMVKKGDVLADASTSDRGQMAIGQNLRVAFLPWFGANYEDAIVLSERLCKEARFTSIHMEEFVCVVRDTKLGSEVTTHDIPNVSEFKLRNLDEDGVIRIGAEVRPGDILVGKVTPKGETQLTPEERLLHAIFGEKAKDVKDTSLRMDGGKRGRVVGIKIFSRENGDNLESGVIKRVHIEIAQLRTVTVGDKLAGRHGNKGVISRVLPEEDMPFDEDGNPVDIILTPLGVPSRMNLGQILELHLGLAADALGYQAVVPSFAGATEAEIREELRKAHINETGKRILFDGRTGEAFSQPVAVGIMYMLKLHHMVEDKMHMRSIGPYSLTTQQPLGGKAQNGGQRVGEMEVWAFLGYGAAHALREILTIKSDDIVGRSAAFDAIVSGKRIQESNTPATFNVLVRHLRGLGIDVEFLENGERLTN